MGLSQVDNVDLATTGMPEESVVLDQSQPEPIKADFGTLRGAERQLRTKRQENRQCTWPVICRCIGETRETKRLHKIELRQYDHEQR